MTHPGLVPEVVCSDIARSLAFHTSVLGFTIAFQPEEDRFAFLEREGPGSCREQPLGRSFVAAELQQPYGGGVNFQIEVSDVNRLHEAAVAPGRSGLLADRGEVVPP